MASLVRTITSAVLGSPLTMHPTENMFATGVLGAANAEIIADADGKSSVILDLRGTFNLSLIHISEPTRPCGTSRMPSSA